MVRALATASLLVLSRVMGMSLVLPDLTTYAGTLTNSAVLAGFALGAYGLTLALMQLPMGMASDRYGRRNVLLLASAVFVAGSIWAAFAATAWELVAARLVQGLGAVSSVGLAWVSDRHASTSAMAVVGAAAGGGFFAGMLLGPILSPVIGVPGLFLVTAGLGTLAAIPLLLPDANTLRPAGQGQPGPAETVGHGSDPGATNASTPEPRSPYAGTHPNAPAPAQGIAATRGVATTHLRARLALAGFASSVALMSAAFFLGNVATGQLTAMLLAALVVMGLGSRLADRSRPLLVASGCLVGMALSGPAFPLAHGWLLVVGGSIFFSCHALLAAILPAAVGRLPKRGRGQGLQNLASHPGTVVGGLLAGVGVQFGLPWMAAGVAAVVTLMGASLLRRDSPIFK